MAKYGTPRTGKMQPYVAQRGVSVYYRSQTDRTPEEGWVVRGGDYKGFGKIPVFCGSRAECEAVAQALNIVHNLL